jgi:uncharacterized membrane protein YdbT with pleckstrin-like domain
MSYVKHVLQPGEEIRHTANIHWITYWPGLVLLVLALVVLFLAESREPGSPRIFLLACGGIIGLAAVVLLVREWWGWWTTEIAVTNRRIIYKTGFISRDTNEMHMDKVESVKVDQSVLGRLLDYGDVTVLGTGTGLETMRTIATPIELRNHITGI